MKTRRIAALVLGFASAAAMAGTAEIRFISPELYADLATQGFQERDTMDALGRHIQRLAAQLPADQVLRVDVLDVDLAGRAQPTRRGTVRVANGLADAPMIHLRYTLEARGQPVRSGEERLVDLGYTDQRASWRATGPYYYEKKLLTDWFSRSFLPQTQAAR
jgi:hypothetical protein